MFEFMKIISQIFAASEFERCVIIMMQLTIAMYSVKMRMPTFVMTDDDN